MKKVLAVVIILAALFGVAIIIGALSGSRGYYYLAIMNTESSPATVQVTMAEGSWQLQPGEKQTVKIKKQDLDETKTERTFTITAGEVKQTIVSTVPYAGTLFLDVAGQGCAAAVDYGRQYRDPNQELPEGQSDIVLKEVFQGGNLYFVESTIATELGSPLPEKVEVSPGTIPTHIRLLEVPCALLAETEGESLYKFLNDH